MFENTLPGFIRPRQKTIQPPPLEQISTKPGKPAPPKKKPQATGKGKSIDAAKEQLKPRRRASTKNKSLEMEVLSLMTPEETENDSDSSSSSQPPIIIRRRSATESLTYTSQE